MRLIDSHAHLQVDAFDADRDGVIQSARQAGLERLLIPGWDATSSQAALDMAAALAGPADTTHLAGGSEAASDWRVDAAVGIHPHEAATATDADWLAVVRLASDPRVVAIGETGLDFDRMHTTPDAQLANLRRHLRLALERGKPAILHCRSAAGQHDAQDALISEMAAAGFGGTTARAAFGERPPAVLHSFSGSVDHAETALEMGVAISFSGLVFRRGEEASGQVARLGPPERLLIETDSPYLAPPGVPRHQAAAGQGSGLVFSGRRNSPEWVRVTASWLAERRGVTPEALGEALVTAYDATFERRQNRQT